MFPVYPVPLVVSIMPDMVLDGVLWVPLKPVSIRLDRLGSILVRIKFELNLRITIIDIWSFRFILFHIIFIFCDLETTDHGKVFGS